ncbi:hypothetical protein K443DRAFT_683938 [Laccaria amethystina LaAM-08-1]|uniref:HNH nuclease domain-containing protein n=1 Tax=Laccaria amethystina LaAM-08-1 TaxID=1095629 RepID=A0A0C9XDB1_9AGAR|nr:hypothetical protein K443DRAFT_683938 [Laccaria amethystina LaAM-08-1]
MPLPHWDETLTCETATLPTKSPTKSPMMSQRNVTLEDFDGNVISGFWQYENATVSWTHFYAWLRRIIQTDGSWTIFELDETMPGRRGPKKTESDLGRELVKPGRYIILKEDGSPISVGLTQEKYRRRPLTVLNTPERVPTNGYRERTRDRDKKCLITDLESTWTRLRAAHIFPRTHLSEWLQEGFNDRITDPGGAPLLQAQVDQLDASRPIKSESKIDSIQNVFLLRADLHECWVNYEFGVNPDDGYRITAFVRGLSDIHGSFLHIEHISDPHIRPLDILFRDHFFQCVLKNVKGATGEPTWDYEDGGFDLSRQDIWGGAEGKERLEVELSNRLFGYQTQAVV